MNLRGLSREAIPSFLTEVNHLILQYLRDRHPEGAHIFEKETRLLLDRDYVEELVIDGSWDELEKYLNKFTFIAANGYSQMTFLHIRRQKFLEAHSRNGLNRAVEILRNDLKIYESWHPGTFNSLLSHLITPPMNLSEIEILTGRNAVIEKIIALISKDPFFANKLEPPKEMKKSRLLELIKQSHLFEHEVLLLHQDPHGIPKNLFFSLDHYDGSNTTSMEFHPTMKILLVGTSAGNVELWNIPKKRKIAFRHLKIWNLKKCLITPKELVEESSVSVNRVAWSPDHQHFGVAYSKNLVHVYRYLNSRDNIVLDHLEIDAHIGSVNDLAFIRPFVKHDYLIQIVTCGDDKTVKVWDASTGTKIKNMQLEHGAPVFSICAYQEEINIIEKDDVADEDPTKIQYICSTSKDGKIKIWLYEDRVPQISYDAPGSCYTRMAYDGSRLFSCGTTKEGDTHLVEWNGREGLVKQAYKGIQCPSNEMVHFDTWMGKYIAAGDQFGIKIWDMDNPENILASIADNDFKATPYIQFDKEGSFLAVESNTGGVHILTTREWIHQLHKADAIAVFLKTGEQSISDELRRPPMVGMVPVTAEQSQCRSMRLNDDVSLTRNCKVSRLTYSNSGRSILALASIGVHSVWKWEDKNATTTEQPQKYIPQSGEPMINLLADRPDREEDHVSCFAISRTDSLLLSSSGGSVSLFDCTTFERRKQFSSFSHPHPQAICIAFQPEDTKIVAIGMKNSSIHIYNTEVNMVVTKLKGHKKEVSGLAFSTALNVLVSSGVDGQLCVWRTVDWKKEATAFLEVPVTVSGVHVQFHQDEKQFLAVHETLLAICYLGIPAKVKLISLWMPDEPWRVIKCATYSCDGAFVYACFGDGNVGILRLTAKISLEPVTWISSNAYIHETIREDCPGLYPTAVAAHPSMPNQFALGLTHGGVYVLEPVDPDAQWS